MFLITFDNGQVELYVTWEAIFSPRIFQYLGGAALSVFFQMFQLISYLEWYVFEFFNCCSTNKNNPHMK